MGARLLGRRTPEYKNLMYKQSLWAWTPRSIVSMKFERSFTLRDDATMLRKFTEHLHFILGFWYKTFPCLLIPHGLCALHNVGLGWGLRRKYSAVRNQILKKTSFALVA